MIIKNCPSNAKGNICFNGKIGASECNKEENCTIKQLVRNLYKVIQSNQCDNCDGIGYLNGCLDKNCGTYQSFKSLEILEIEE